MASRASGSTGLLWTRVGFSGLLFFPDFLLTTESNQEQEEPVKGGWAEVQAEGTQGCEPAWLVSCEWAAVGPGAQGSVSPLSKVVLSAGHSVLTPGLLQAMDLQEAVYFRVNPVVMGRPRLGQREEVFHESWPS